MEPGVIAAIVILSVELIIIIVVLVFLFTKKRPPKPPRKDPSLEAGVYKGDENVKVVQEIDPEKQIVEEKTESVAKDENSESEASDRNEDDKTQAKRVDSSSSSSSDEGVGDVTKTPSRETSSSEEMRDRQSPPASSSSSDASSMTAITDEPKHESERETTIKIVEETPITRSSPSLENGITLSLRLENLAENKANSSSSSSSSEDENEIQVIRRYEDPPSLERNSDKGISVIYDPVNRNIMNLDDFMSERSDEETEKYDEVVAGIINVTSGEKLTISRAVSKGLIPEKTGMLLLEAQAATGSVVNPRTGVKLSVDDAIRQGVVDSRYKQNLIASEGAYYGYLDPRRNESVPLFKAIQRGIFPRSQGMRLLEAQAASGGIVDPWTGKRHTLPSATRKGLIDEATAQILKYPEDHADFFDPNTKQRFSYSHLLSKCIRDLNTGLKFLYLEEKPSNDISHYRHDITFRSAFRRKVTLSDLVTAGLVSQQVLDQFSRGQITKNKVYDKVKKFLVGELPIAGVYNRTSHEVMTICQAVRGGLLRRGTALELLEAQAATGNIIDPRSGRQMSVNRAISVGLVDSHFASALRKAEFAVFGYKSGNNQALSLSEAMKRGLVIEIQGIRLLDAQIATGGMIDPVGGYRIPMALAVKRGMLDQQFASSLENLSPDQKGYYDPNTDENLSYGELMRRTVMDKKRHVGMRLLPLTDKTPNVRVVNKPTTSNRKIYVRNPNTNQPMSLREAEASNFISLETARNLRSGQRS